MDLGFVLSCVVWGLVVLSVLVFAHEAGHFGAARACGVRVTELFLGMPSRLSASREIKSCGTRLGVTPVLLGGYTRIFGMAGEESPLMAPALACVQSHGVVAADDLALEIGCDSDEAYAILAELVDWGSIEAVYDPELGEREGQQDWPRHFGTIARDAEMLTKFDRGHRFEADGFTAAGVARPVDDAVAFLNDERSRTYQGKGFLSRLAMLLGGPVASFVAGVLLFIASLSFLGQNYAVNSNVLGGISEGSLAEGVGLRAGDEVTSLAGNDVNDFNSLGKAIKEALKENEPFDLVFVRGGVSHEVTVTPHGEQALGVSARTETVRVPVTQAISFVGEYCSQTLQLVGRLFNPSSAAQAVGETSSVVGISVMAGQAARSGPGSLAFLAAIVSLSLSIMNMLPIPPLDGGKILIEVVQVVLRRPLSMRAQNAISMAGIALFLLLFVVVVRQDIVRLFVG